MNKYGQISSMRLFGGACQGSVMKVKRLIACAAVVGLAWATQAAATFEKVPAEAQAALKGARGKPVRTGLVFVNGHYLPPPYTVARYGTAIFINNVQVTDQIVSWKLFLSTQAGGASATPAAAPEKKKGSAIDDLFEDDAPPAAPAPAAKAEGGSSFVPNVRTQQMLKRINDYRTEVNKRLLNGETCFFGTRYARVNVSGRLARSLLDVLPEAVRDAADGAELFARMKSKGFGFLTSALCADLIEHRADYAALVERRQKVREDENFRKMLSNGGQGLSL